MLRKVLRKVMQKEPLLNYKAPPHTQPLHVCERECFTLHVWYRKTDVPQQRLNSKFVCDKPFVTSILCFIKLFSPMANVFFLKSTYYCKLCTYRLLQHLFKILDGITWYIPEIEVVVPTVLTFLLGFRFLVAMTTILAMNKHNLQTNT